MTSQGILFLLVLVLGPGLVSTIWAFANDWTARKRSAAAKLMLLAAWPVLLPRRAREDGEPAMMTRGTPGGWIALLLVVEVLCLTAGWTGGWLLTNRWARFDLQRHVQAHRVSESERAVDRLANFIRWAPRWYPKVKNAIPDAVVAEAAYRPVITEMRINALIEKGDFAAAGGQAAKYASLVEKKRGRSSMAYAHAACLLARASLKLGKVADAAAAYRSAMDASRLDPAASVAERSEINLETARFFANQSRYEREAAAKAKK